MENLKKRISRFIFIITVILIIAPFVIEYFTKTKMGAYRYIIAKNRKLEVIFNSGNINMLKIVFLLTLIAGILFIMVKNKKYIKFSLQVITFSTIGLILTLNEFELNSYYFLIISVIVCTILSLLSLTIRILFK